MLTAEYLQINGEPVAIPPATYSDHFEEIETVNKSEAGTDLTNVTRLDKMVIDLSWEGIYSDFLAQITEWCQSDTVTVTFMGVTFEARARGLKRSMAKKSYLYSRSDGIWNASFTLTEV